jgi:hypothetical protein
LKGLRAQFGSLGRDLYEEAKFKYALTQLLGNFRKFFDDFSLLAKSIESNGSSKEMIIIPNRASLKIYFLQGICIKHFHSERGEEPDL